MDKIVQLPSKTLDVTGPDGQPNGKTVNAFLHYLGIAIETKPHKESTDAFLAHKIREKIDDLKPGAKTMIFGSDEITFINLGIENLRSAGRMAGSGWYFLLSPLQDAKPVGKEK